MQPKLFYMRNFALFAPFAKENCSKSSEWSNVKLFCLVGSPWSPWPVQLAVSKVNVKMQDKGFEFGKLQSFEILPQKFLPRRVFYYSKEASVFLWFYSWQSLQIKVTDILKEVGSTEKSNTFSPACIGWMHILSYDLPLVFIKWSFLTL